MKHVTYVLLIIFAASNVSAQTEKGNFLVGGTLTASNSSNNIGSVDATATGFGISPSVSYFFADKFAAGLITNYSYSATKSESGGVTSKTNILSNGIGPTVRYYFPLGEKVWLFPEVDYLWGGSHTQLRSNGAVTNDLKGSTRTFRIGPGVAYFITKSVGIEGLLFYQNQNQDQTSASPANSVTFSSTTSGINLRIGLQVYISRSNE
jgi:hypothetical protein